MEETFEELVTKHTRRELEDMAQAHRVENLGGTKSQLAEAIIEAIKLQKTIATNALSQPEEHMPKKTRVPAERPALQGKKGVMAKVSAINSKSGELQKAGREIREDGIREMTKGVRELHSATDKMSKDMAAEARKMLEDGQQRFNAGQAAMKSSIGAQIKENRDSAAKFDGIVREFRSSTEKMSGEFQRAGKNIRDEGCRDLQKGLKQFRSGVASQIKENRDAASKMDSGARELLGRARSFQQEVQRYQEQNLKNYIRDFYYG